MAEHSPKRLGRGYLWMGATAVLFGGMFYYLLYYPEKDLGLRQPIFFSHRVHAGVKQIPCRFCHPFVERSSNAGIPPMEKCFFCHNYIIPLHPQIQEEKKDFLEKKPVRWERAFILPEFVFFNHIPHVRWAGLDCSECHGEVKAMDRLVRTKFKMQFCITCHRRMGAQIDCWLACHR
jgi:predicted CXXCH cytochrome family protein